MPTQTKSTLSQPNEAYTQEFNFPKPWVRDYNPQLHGVQFKPATAATTSTLAQPEPKSGSLPHYTVTQHQQAVAHHNWHHTPVQWNPDGVYGGVVEPRKNLPTWTWIALAAIIIVLLALALFMFI